MLWCWLFALLGHLQVFMRSFHPNFCRSLMCLVLSGRCSWFCFWRKIIGSKWHLTILLLYKSLSTFSEKVMFMAVYGEYKEVVGTTVCEQNMILSSCFFKHSCFVQWGTPWDVLEKALVSGPRPWWQSRFRNPGDFFLRKLSDAERPE